MSQGSISVAQQTLLRSGSGGRLAFSHHLPPRDPLRPDIRLLATRHKASLSKRIQLMSYEHAYSQIIDERDLKINEVPPEKPGKVV